MKRLPVKSLVQFRSVSKAWKCLIDSSEFVVAHSLLCHNHHLLVSYEHTAVVYDVLFSRCYIDDDDDFPQQKSFPILPLSVKQIVRPTVIGTSSSQGLLCFYGLHPDFSTMMAVLWNPSIRKSVSILVPGEPSLCSTYFPEAPIVGFGVCPITLDPKIVSISTQTSSSSLQVFVYTLSSGKWRNLSTTDLPSIQTGWLLHSVVTNRFIYWDVELQDLKMVMSFDLTSESFELIHLPDILAHHSGISKLRDSLVFIQYVKADRFSTVWMMGAEKSFTKLFTITTPHYSTVGFRNNGIPIMVVEDDDDEVEQYNLFVYEPNSQPYTLLEICDSYSKFSVHSYMETLLLHGRSDCTSY